MRIKKLRGHNRLQRKIKYWELNCIEFNIKNYFKKGNDYNYEKIAISPLNNIQIGNSKYAQPFGKTKQRIIESLINIYNNYSIQLNELKTPFYLKIWLYEPNITKSQIVYAIGDRIEFYNNSFNLPENIEEFKINATSEINEKLSQFNWERRLDEFHYEADEELLKTHWFKKLLKQKHSFYLHTFSNNETVDIYSFKEGNVWIGSKNNTQ